MAKAYYKEWLEPDKLLLIRGWKMKGLTDEQIAKNIGIHPRTLEKWKKNYGQIRQVLKRGKEQANYIVENALFQKAAKGNTTAMIFWLKNNYQEKYTDKTDDDKEYTKSRIAKTNAETKLIEQNIGSLDGEQTNSVDKLLNAIMDESNKAGENKNDG